MKRSKKYWEHKYEHEACVDYICDPFSSVHHKVFLDPKDGYICVDYRTYEEISINKTSKSICKDSARKILMSRYIKEKSKYMGKKVIYDNRGGSENREFHFGVIKDIHIGSGYNRNLHVTYFVKDSKTDKIEEIRYQNLYEGDEKLCNKLNKIQLKLKKANKEYEKISRSLNKLLNNREI